MRLIAFGAHPDDCEYRCGGLAAKLAAAGHAVKFVSMTDGRCGHHKDYGDSLAARRRLESDAAARALGIAASEVLPNPDGALEATLANRLEVVRRIREWQADVVITHRPNDYHADHRYTAQLVMDAAFLVQVPGFCPDAPALRFNPCFLYMRDNFRLPTPFSPDLVVDIRAEWARKIDSIAAHASQFYEWLPWLAGRLDDVPAPEVERRHWIEKTYFFDPEPREEFELSEYGGRLHRDQWQAFLPDLSIRDSSGCFSDQTS